MAAQYKKPVIVLPRRASQREHTTDHQLQTARWLERIAGVFVAWHESDLDESIERALMPGVELRVPESAPSAFVSRLRQALISG
jgi:UDP-N-acetylglucosamine transferase subunit ALG13